VKLVQMFCFWIRIW